MNENRRFTEHTSYLINAAIGSCYHNYNLSHMYRIDSRTFSLPLRPEVIRPLRMHPGYVMLRLLLLCYRMEDEI